MKKLLYISTYFPLAVKAGEKFSIRPNVILAQSALETGWGESTLAKEHNNFFGITGYGRKNDYWKGTKTELGKNSLLFRTYDTPKDSFMDFARLIRAAYPRAADMSHHPKAFAKEIAYSKYISEVNGDNREAYRKAIISICRTVDNFVCYDISNKALPVHDID